MTENEHKIYKLIETGDDVNIKLAFQLAKANKNKLDISAYQRLYDWLWERKKVGWNYRSPLRTILELSKISSLHITEFHSSGFIPPNLPLLMNLEALIISNVNLGSIPSFVLDMKNLKHLELRACGITEIPDEISNLTNLTDLDLGDNSGLKEVNEEVFNLSKLHYLGLGYTGIKELSPSIEKLQDLGVLHISKTKITKFPESIVNCHWLQVIYAGFNDIKTLPEGMYSMPKLTKVNMFNTTLTDWDVEMAINSKTTFITNNFE
jgi:internalin A